MKLTSNRRWWAVLAILGVAGAGAGSYYAFRSRSIPKGPLRIGFKSNPPFQIRTAAGYSGLSVDVVREAARRRGIRLEWVEPQTSSEEAIEKGLVDLWPLMGDLPERRKKMFLSRPWAVAHHILVMKSGVTVPDRDFGGPISILDSPLQIRLAIHEVPKAVLLRLPDAHQALKQVCTGAAGAAFLEKRTARMLLQDLPKECQDTDLRIHELQRLRVKAGLASTFAAADAARLLRDEIGTMYRDGSLGVLMAKYSFYGLDDAWSDYHLMESVERTKWVAWSSAASVVVLVLALWQIIYLRQRSRSERVLRESEARFRAIFDQAGVGVAQIGLDGRVVIANDRYCEVLGRKPSDMVGRGTREMSPGDDLKKQIAMMPRLLAGEIQTFSTEKRYQRDDGSVVWAVVYKSLVRDGNGQPTGFIAVVEDITDRKEAESAIKESEERFRNMADSAPVLMWVSGPDRLRTFFNRRWLEFTGRTMEQELGDGWAECIHPEDRERCMATYELSFDRRRNFQMEYRLLRSDGEYRFVLDHGVARSSDHGVFAGYIGSCLDITELKNNYERHLAMQKLESLGVLAAGVAHDFNNLLGAIVAQAEAARSELTEGSPAASDVEQVRVTALRAAEIVSQLMTFARQENAPRTAVDLSQLVAETIGLVRVSIAKSAVLKTELAADLPPVYANAAEIRQVVMNLVINASEALEGQMGLITITTSTVTPPEGPYTAVRLDVRDTGSGMTEEVKARIFDPFFTRRFVGRGLGLSAVQGIVRRHDGSIEIESEPGKGSRFTVVLPCANGQTPAPLETSAPLETAAPAATSARARGGVLFIDDEDSLRTAVSKILRRSGFNVVEAADGPAAIEILATNGKDIGIILLDVTLPGISGVELLDELCRIRRGVKVIVSTAYSRETAMSRFEGREVWGFIRKPYRGNDLVKLLEQATGSQR
ncbi:MAG: PAS domain S-box protein [Candidatus Solibacter sp.]